MGRERGWTDEDLIAAVEQSTTIVEVLARLGLAVGGASLAPVRRRMLELGLDRPDLLRLARSTKWAADPADDVAHASTRGRWTEDELRMAVIASTSMRQVMQHLGYRGSGGAWTAAKNQILTLGLDTSHFGRSRSTRSQTVPDPPRLRRRWTDHDLARAVEQANSVAGVLRQLGLKPGGSMYVSVQDAIVRLGLDTGHFNGQGWRKGASTPVRAARPLSEILVENSRFTSSHLRKRLIQEGVKEAACEGCGRTEWRGAPIPLQLDHINGDRTDNRLENLRLLCPNCHAQTDTWCSKNRGRFDRLAPVLQLVDRPGSKSGAFGHEGSTPSGRTAIQLTFSDLEALD
jgi:hypothetical protein